MKGKNSFLKNKKEIKAGLGNIMISSVESGAGFLTAKGGIKLISDKILEKNPDSKIVKFRGPLLYLIGTGMEAFIKNPHIAALGRGVAMSGFDYSAADMLSDDFKSKIGLSGMGAPSNKQIDGGKGFNWEEAARIAIAQQQSNQNSSKENSFPGVGSYSDVNDVATSAMLN